MKSRRSSIGSVLSCTVRIGRFEGAVLAALLARWLAGHCVPDDRFQTILMRGRILNEHMKIVRDLTKVTAMQMELEIMD